jgi:pimeloyl-ACP methyl ester carboxylesterase
MGATGSRDAVLVIHGIGEQRPMTTLRGFVDGMMGSTELYSLPNWANVSFELSTLVKPPESGGYDKQIDFYEGYWAPDARGTRISHVRSWAQQLLLRRPGNVPGRLRPLWWTAVVLVTAALIIAVTGVLDLILNGDTWWSVVLKLVATALPAVVAGWITSSLGDAARYLDDRPANVEMRQTIRTRVIEMLEYLHTSKRYDRIIVIGHSLGGVIAYDAVRLLWQRRVCGSEFTLLDQEQEVVARAADLQSDTSGKYKNAALQEFRRSQRELSRELSAEEFDDGSRKSPRWLISDLVTVGAPIAYPTLFMSSRKVSLPRRVKERGLSSCPPSLAVTTDGAKSFCFTSPHSGRKYIHHGAVFSAVRWTNVYAKFDFVGGPIFPALGGNDANADAGLGIGVRNFEVTKGRFVNIPVLNHSQYWRRQQGDNTSYQALISVLQEG